MVGMAGHSHWSLSLEAKDDGRLVFDVACRVGKAVAWLGSQYEILRPFCQSSRWEIGDCLVELATVADNSQIQNHSGRMAVRPDDSSTEVPHTFRWQYQVSIGRRPGV